MEQRLGRGLDSLIARTVTQEDGPREQIPLAEIRVNPNQPRRHWNEESLAGLAASIKLHGVLQPIVVHRVGAVFELIAGERRFRATKIAGLDRIPATLVDSAGLKSLELALIENIQREDLNSHDEAVAYQQLLSQNAWTHEELATRVGKSRVTVTNALRLLELPDEVIELLADGRLSAGQARAVLAVGNAAERVTLARMAVEKGLSVREVERLARQGKEAKTKGSAARTGVSKQDHYELELRRIYGTKASFHGNATKGHIRLDYYSAEDRDRLIHQLLTGEADG